MSDILSTIGGPSYQQAVEELCAEVIALIRTLPAEKTGGVERALGNLQGAAKPAGGAFRVSTYMDAYRREVAGGVPEAAAHDAAVRNVLTTLPMAMNIALSDLAAIKEQLARIEGALPKSNEAGR